jgi:hypothetical protein
LDPESTEYKSGVVTNTPELLIALVYKRKYYFSVTSIKVDELNSVFYAEFKFVLSFSLSRKVFKGHTVII